MRALLMSLHRYWHAVRLLRQRETRLDQRLRELVSQCGEPLGPTDGGWLDPLQGCDPVTRARAVGAETGRFAKSAGDILGRTQAGSLTDGVST